MEQKDITSMNPDDAAITSIRRCGHFLHHSSKNGSGKTNAELLAALSDQEKILLTELLNRCLESWKA